MDKDLRARIEHEAETAALFNALKHGSAAQIGPIMDPLIGDNPEFRPHRDEIPGLIAPVIATANERSAAEKRERLHKLAPERLAELDAEDERADRLFFVRDGVEKTLLFGPESATPPVHPDHGNRGTRDIQIGNAVLVEPDDVPPNGKRIWLKGYGPVRHTRDAFEYTGEDIDIVHEGDVDVVHWVPADENVPTRLRTMDGGVTGHAEPGLTEYAPGDIVQFERIGFVRVDRHSDEEIVAYFVHP